MRIKRLTATFGGLQNESLFLQPGMNIITSPNESGKSTWCAFIRAMLYGIDSSQREKNGIKPDKLRYAPFSGLAMQGEMEIEHEGKDITISRATKTKNAPMRIFSAHYTGTATAVPGLTESETGEILTGMPRGVFENSVFVRQSGMGVTHTPELEKRIGAMAFSGEEGVSFTQAEESLKMHLRKRNYRKSGAIPQLQAELYELQDAIDRGDALRREMLGLEASLQELSTKADELEKEKQSLEKGRTAFENLKLRRQYDSLSLSAEKLRREQAELEDKERLMRQKAREESDKTLAENSRKTMELQHLLDEARETEIRSLAQLQSGVFTTKEPAKARAEVQNTLHRLEENEEKAAHMPKLSVPMAILLGCVLIIIAGIFINLAISGVGVLAAIPGVIMLRRSLHERSLAASAKAENREILSSYGVQDAAELEKLLLLHTELYEKWEGALEKENELRALLHEAQSRLHDHAPNEFEEQAEALREQRSKCGGELMELLGRLSALSERLAEAPTAAEAAEFSPERFDEVCTALAENAAERGELSRRLSVLEGRLQAVGDPMVLSTQHLEKTHRLAELESQCEDIQLAIETLQAANDEMQTRFAPVLGKKAAEFMSCLTNGAYERLTFSRELNARAKKSGETLDTEDAYLSGGTYDQLYLSLRLAIALTTPGAEKGCPIVLDDALVNFDDERAKRALQLLTELSKERQIILFSCQDREQRFYEELRK